ncbi:MAG: two-component system response regulator BtsR [Psychromonas sp.]|nr:two-component system response regulator BtsR [Psychromonas sp.]
MLKAIVIDDELYAREELIALLDESGQIEIIASCNNAIEGLRKVNSLKPDVIFLDIEMPQISGLEMLSMLAPETMPQVVFVTAYDDYAVKAFEDNAFDYILKPVEPMRLAKTLTRLQSCVTPVDYQPLLQQQLELIPCAGYNRIVLVKPDAIEVAYSDQSGVHVINNDSSQIHNSVSCSLSLKVLEQKTCLIRCHRQYLVNPSAIREIKFLEHSLAEIITANGAVAPVSRRYLKALKDRFLLS